MKHQLTLIWSNGYAIMKCSLCEREAKCADWHGHDFMMRSIASCTQHTLWAARRTSLKKAHCFRNALFSGSIEPNVYF